MIFDPFWGDAARPPKGMSNKKKKKKKKKKKEDCRYESDDDYSSNDIVKYSLAFAIEERWLKIKF